MLTVAMVAVVRLTCLVLLLVVGREGRDQVGYACEECQRHAIAVSSVDWVFVYLCICDSRSDRHNVNRWWSDEDCAVSAYSENFAVWGEVRLGRREVGANTYTAVVVVDSVVWRGCFCDAYGQMWRVRGVARLRLSEQDCVSFVVQLPVTSTG